MSGDVALQTMLDKLRKLPGLAREIAPDVARTVRGSLEAQIAKGTDPSGKPWQKTQDGRTPLRKAADALRVTAVASRVIAALQGPEARHSKGRARGGIKRQVLPEGRIPSKMADEIRETVVREFSDRMGGQ